MNNSLKYLTLLLVGATLACAETKPPKESVKPVPASHPAAEQGAAPATGKPGTAKPNADGRLIEVGYGVKPLDTTEKAGPGDGFFKSPEFLVICLVFLTLIILWLIYVIFFRKKPLTIAPVYNPVPTSPVSGTFDFQQLNQSIAALSVRLQSLATAQANTIASINGLGGSLAPKVADAAVTALTNSDLGKARKRIETLEGEIFAAQTSARQAVEERGRLSEESLSFKGQAEQAAREKGEAEAKVTAAQATIARLEGELEAKVQLIADSQAEAANERSAAAQLRADANKGYEVLAPAKLKATELGSQMQAMYQASLSGDVAAIAAWSTLTTFASAQADPVAKDFQLQIVRRLGVALVGYWKHQSLSEKERHEKLSHWAKSLNENADSRFNLLVPGLGEPIDKTRMTCATSSTAIREVLCWQVRNPSGASFSLAEVA